MIAGPFDVCWPRGSLALMPPPLAPPGSPICSSPCIHHSRSGSDPFWMSLVASVASQDLHNRHLHSVWAASSLPHSHIVSALTQNWFRPLRWVVRTAVAGPQQMSHLNLAHCSTAPRTTPNQCKKTRPIKTPHTRTRPRLLRMGDFGTFGGQLLCCWGSTLHWLP